ncbi:Zinc finger, CCHC-type superfamily [Sesbania bispinosa]|nr:Zinc finger, CCHC-type superfamily [Sesbania bispinosa]
MASYHATYEHHVQPLQGEEFWETTDQLPPVPPNIQRKAGRPKKQRRKEGDGRESAVNPRKLKRKLADYTCRICEVKGHNKQKCPVTKRQRQENLEAQQKQNASAKSGPSATAGAPTHPPNEIGPSSTAPNSTATQNPVQEEIELTQSQPPNHHKPN